jgi:RNA polymerase sigma-70 factor (ECF subfamily)
MTQDGPFDRLSQISTTWSVLFQAHDEVADVAKEARRKLMRDYGAPVYRYLLAAVRDAETADELYQEFALRFVRGDFRRAHPDRGRFRDFLKTALYHLIVDHYRRRERQPQPLPEQELAASSILTHTPGSDEEFITAWRGELLERAWSGLEQFERETGRPLYTVLRFRTEHPELQSPQMSEQLTQRLGRPVTAAWVRKRLQQGRAKFVELLLQELKQTLEDPTGEELEQELLELGLLDYCRSALAKYAERRPTGLFPPSR